MYPRASLGVLMMTTWLLSGVTAVPLHRLGKRDDGDDDDEDEDEQQDRSTQTVALISVFTVVGIICLAVSSMAAFHYRRKRALLKDDRCLEEEGTAQQGAKKNKNLDDNYEPRCAWCYIAENKLCTWCAGEKSDPDNGSAGTTIYSSRVSEEREMGATTPQIPAKASFRPDVGVYTIPSPPASFKGKGRARDESGAPSPTIERT